MTEPTDQELVDMAASSPHRDLIRQAIRLAAWEQSAASTEPESEKVEEQESRVSLLTQEVLEHRTWLAEQGIHLSPCFWIRNKPTSSDE